MTLLVDSQHTRGSGLLCSNGSALEPVKWEVQCVIDDGTAQATVFADAGEGQSNTDASVLLQGCEERAVTRAVFGCGRPRHRVRGGGAEVAVGLLGLQPSEQQRIENAALTLWVHRLERLATRSDRPRPAGSLVDVPKLCWWVI